MKTRCCHLLLAVCTLFACKKKDKDTDNQQPASTEKFSCVPLDSNYALQEVTAFQAWEAALFPVAVSSKDSVTGSNFGYSTSYTRTGATADYVISFNDTLLLHYYAVAVNQQGAVIERRDTVGSSVGLSFVSGQGQHLAPDSCYRIYILAQDPGGAFNTFKGFASYRH